MTSLFTGLECLQNVHGWMVIGGHVWHEGSEGTIYSAMYGLGNSLLYGQFGGAAFGAGIWQLAYITE